MRRAAAMLDRIVYGATRIEAGLTSQIQQEIEEKQIKLPLEVDYWVQGEKIPSRVVRLLKPYFIIEVGRSRQLVKIDYTGEIVGSKRRIPKKHESPFPREFNPGVFGKDLQIVRVLSGRSANA